MDYQTYPPSADLVSFIKCFWTLQVPGEVPKDRQQILPDGCIELIFTLADDIKRYTAGDQYIIQPRSMILGQITQPLFIEPLGEVNTFATRFFPGAFSHFSKVSIDKLTDRETPIHEVFEQHAAQQLEHDIQQAEHTAERIKIVDDFLLSCLELNANVDELVKSTIDLIFATKGGKGINKMMEQNRSRRRKLERKFSQTVGLSPKQLCKIIRLQTTLQSMLHKKDRSLTEVGYESQYFDQSHFIKDFRSFTGISPKELYSDGGLALSNTIYGHEKS